MDPILKFMSVREKIKVRESIKFYFYYLSIVSRLLALLDDDFPLLLPERNKYLTILRALEKQLAN
jgi:hypothetical protein